MINDENFTYYLRYLVRTTDKRPLTYNEIPQAFSDFFSIPALSQALNILIPNPPYFDYLAVENYLDNNTFDSIDSLCEGIKSNFTTDIEKLYAAYYYTTHNVEYDWNLFLHNRGIFNPTTKSVFKTKKGICGDYSRLFIKISKKSGVNMEQIKLSFYVNVSKASSYKPFFPPKDRKSIESNLHASVFLQLGDQMYMSEPTWGAGRTKDGVFIYDYKRPLFLIPYNIGLLQHYPYEIPYKINCPFSWEQFTKLNRVNINREVSLESNPFQVVKLKNGFYEIQFSFVRFQDEIAAQFQMLKNDEWINEKPFFVLFTCLDKKVPCHHFTYYPDKFRARYKLTVILNKKGAWKVIVQNDRKLFDVYFVVDEFDESLHMVPSIKNQEEKGFFPLTPLKVLTSVNNGFARIRFAMDKKFASALTIKTYKVNRSDYCGTENKILIENILHSFSMQIFDNELSNLIEKWLFVDFPSNGLWEVCMYSKIDEKYMFCASYLFDVKNSGIKKFSPVFDLPKTRKFSPFNDEFFSVSPSFSSVVVKKSEDFHFHVFSRNEIVDRITGVCMKREVNIVPKIVSEKETDVKDVKDREYSITFTDCGHYSLKLNGNQNENDDFQNYFVVDFDLPDESDKEKKMMSDFKNEIQKEFDYNDDIPASIKEQVDQMLVLTSRQREINGNESACCLLI